MPAYACLVSAVLRRRSHHASFFFAFFAEHSGEVSRGFGARLLRHISRVNRGLPLRSRQANIVKQFGLPSGNADHFAHAYTNADAASGAARAGSAGARRKPWLFQCHWQFGDAVPEWSGATVR